MRSGQRLWGRRLTLAVAVVGAAATTMGVSQCGTTSGSTVTASGGALTIYASVPPGTPGGADLFDAEKLAWSQAGGKAGTHRIRFLQLNRMPSDNARTAIQDTSAIAYLGEIGPGASKASMGINEDQDLLQVTPTDTAIAETQSTPAVSGAPKSYYEQFSTYGRTFARVVPSGTAEARVQVQEMRALGVKKLYVANDGSDYGAAIAYAVQQDAPGAGLTVTAGPPMAANFTSSGSDALFFGALAQNAGQVAALFQQVGSHAKLFVPSALATSTFASSLGSAVASLYATEPGFLPKDLPTSAETQFIKPFKAAYGHAPATSAIFGYEAMSAVLSVIRQAGSQANNRSTVVHDFLGIRDRQSVVGTYSIDSNGDTNIAPFLVSRFRSGALVPFKFVTASP